MGMYVFAKTDGFAQGVLSSTLIQTVFKGESREHCLYSFGE